MIELVFAAAGGGPWSNPIIVGLVVGAPATWFGIKAYRRAEALDKEAASKATLAAKGEDIQRAFDAFDRIVENLQDDNKDVRQRLRDCNTAYDELKRMLPRSS